jgi:hypothetical protein
MKRVKEEGPARGAFQCIELLSQRRSSGRRRQQLSVLGHDHCVNRIDTAMMSCPVDWYHIIAATAQYIQIGATYNCMNNSNSPSNPASSRVTLKLKGGARKPVTESKTPALPQPHSKANLKPGAHWSDEYKERMQADMDALTSR